MPELRVWFYFVVVFTVAVAVLMVGAAIHERWLWKREQMSGEDRMMWALLRIVIGIVAAGILLAVLMIKAFAHDEDHSHDAWYGSLMQPDNPSVSCCGLADAYWCDDYYARDGKAYCRITDDRDDAPLHRPHVPLGTEFEIPPYKLKWDQKSNPTGHSVIFVNTSGHVWCFVGNGGV